MEIYFKQSFETILWRILPSQSALSDEWIIETRNPDNKTVHHTLIDLAIPSTVWHTTLSEIEWSTQLAGFSKELLLFHSYRYPDLPQADDLIGITTQTGKIVWTLPNHTLLRLEGEHLLLTLYRGATGLQEKWFDLSSGHPIAIENPVVTTTSVPSYTAPIRYLPDNIYFTTINTFIKELLSIPDAEVIDYLETTDFLVLSYYLYQENEYQQWLLVLDKDSSILYHQSTGNQLTGIGSDTILFKNNKLVFLTNNNEFTSLNLLALQ